MPYDAVGQACASSRGRWKMPDRADHELRRQLDRLIAECDSVGRECEVAATRLGQSEALPSAELIERLGKLRSEWDGILAEASKVLHQGSGDAVAFPRPEYSLGDAIAFVERAIAPHRNSPVGTPLGRSFWVAFPRCRGWRHGMGLRCRDWPTLAPLPGHSHRGSEWRRTLIQWRTSPNSQRGLIRTVDF